MAGFVQTLFIKLILYEINIYLTVRDEHLPLITLSASLYPLRSFFSSEIIAVILARCHDGGEKWAEPIWELLCLGAVVACPEIVIRFAKN